MKRYPDSWKSNNTTKSHLTANFIHRYLLRGKRNRRVTASAKKRNWPEDRADTDFLGKDGTFQGEAFQGGGWWDHKVRDWAFYSVGWGLSRADRVVRMFCG